MNNWRTIQLGDYYEFSSGLSKSADQFGFGFPFLSFSDVFWNYFMPNELSNLVNSSKKERISCSVKQGDVFLTRTSETDDELGMSCVALKDYPEATFNGFTKRLRPKKQGEIDPVFIGFYMRSPYFRAQVSAYSNIITRASLNNDILGRLKIFVPQYDEQKQIGETLIKYTRIIENINQRIKLLEQMAEEIYKEWFVRMRFPGYETAKFYSKEGLEVNRGIAGAMPEGWKKVKLGSILATVKRKPKISTDQYLTEGLYPIIDQGETFISGYTNDESIIQHEPLPLLVFGDHTRRIKFVSFPFASGADGTQLLYPKNSSLLPIYFYISVRNIDLSNFHYARHFKFLKHEYILVPDDKTLFQFNNLTNPFFDEIQILKDKNQLLQQTRDLLLPRLISGKLSVEHIVEEVVHLPMAAEPEVTFNTKRSS